jgi:hypothetical protein
MVAAALRCIHGANCRDRALHSRKGILFRAHGGIHGVIR